MAKRTNIRRRGRSWIVYFRVDGKQVWKSFKTREEAELYLARARTQVVRGEYRRPTKVGFREAAEEWLRHGEHERHLKPSTLRDYRSAVNAHLLPAFGKLLLEQVTAPTIEAWRAREMAAGRLPRRSASKMTAILHGIFERARKAYGFPANPVADVERHAERYSGSYDFYSPTEVMALVRAADSDQDGAIFLTAAFSGLRMGELIALRWRDVDFDREALRVHAGYVAGELGTPKSGRVRSVPMVPEVAKALARLGQREELVGDDDLVFPGDDGYLDGSALRRRYKAALVRAKLRPLRFHDLRHCFGSLAINKASIVQVQHWMGHADVKTTMRYLHHKSRSDDARLLADAFAVTDPTPLLEEAPAAP